MSEIRTLISFNLGNQVFAFDSLMVRNIIEFNKVTKVPNSEDFVLGVINLHGNIVPVIDLKMVTGMGVIEKARDTTIIVVSPEDKLDSQFGVVVDMVSEVFEVPEVEIEESAFQEGMGLIDHFEGALKRGQGYIQIISLPNLLSRIEG